MTKIERKTKETDIVCQLCIDDIKQSKIETGIGFFDHMLEAFAKHSGIYIYLTCKGDIEVDAHHTVEDCAIVLGQALHNEIFPVSNIQRFSDATIVMDEASSTTVIDISNRPYLVFDMAIDGFVGELPTELVEEFFYALVTNMKISCHIINNRGKNKHHIIESIFKSFAISLKKALTVTKQAGIPSTKGIV